MSNLATKIDVEKLPNGRVEVRAARPAGHISAAFGFLKKTDGPGLTVDEINEAAAAGWAGER